MAFLTQLDADVLTMLSINTLFPLLTLFYLIYASLLVNKIYASSNFES